MKLQRGWLLRDKCDGSSEMPLCFCKTVLCLFPYRGRLLTSITKLINDNDDDFRIPFSRLAIFTNFERPWLYRERKSGLLRTAEVDGSTSIS